MAGRWTRVHLRTLGGTVEQVALGGQGLVVGRQGLGCMGMSQSYGAADRGEAAATLRAAAEAGVTLFDTADLYGAGHNEELLGEVLGPMRDSVVIATKFGITRNAKGQYGAINGRPEYVASACEASLARLGIEVIDLYYQHRVDPQVPVEETVGAMAQLVAEGKVRYLGLSEASAATLERAHAVHPITALQSEWSMFTRELEADVVPTARRLGVGLVPYSPLGRGVLSGTLRSDGDLAEDDWRRTTPRFHGEGLAANLELVDQLADAAATRGLTTAQLALAWVHARGRDVVPIPGTKRRRWLADNLASLEVQLTDGDCAQLEALVRPEAVVGDRYPAAFMGTLNA